ncbi:parB-like nuclease domain protein [Mycobacterium kansasii 732]|nr:parB-like nuclease domain protein [Mycobacterium kansasii 732]
MPAMNPAEARALTQHETVIERGIKTFIAVGTALAAIRDQRLYRERYATFENYCHMRWGLSRSRAYRLIDAANVVDSMSPIGDTVPATESQARELMGLTPTQAATVMRVAHEQTSGKITAAAIRAARSRPWTEAEITTAVDGYRIHPFIACYPPFKPDEWSDLVASIARLGLIQSIIVSADRTTIIDGRFRYLALKWNGIDPATATTLHGLPALKSEPNSDDTKMVIACVQAMNRLRTHYTADQIAVIRAEIAGQAAR